MNTNARESAEQFAAVLEGKIKTLVAEFGEGKISREQFHVIYQRYSGKLAIANHAIASGNPDAITIAQDGLSTVMMRSELEGKAMGLMIYHLPSASPLETLGEFNVPMNIIAPVLNDISAQVDEGKSVERRVKRVREREWLVFITGRHTVAVTEFHNEPSQIQYLEIERLHRDFENANRTLLDKDDIDPNRLAYPFIVFVQKKIGT